MEIIISRVQIESALRQNIQRPQSIGPHSLTNRYGVRGFSRYPREMENAFRFHSGSSRGHGEADERTDRAGRRRRLSETVALSIHGCRDPVG